MKHGDEWLVMMNDRLFNFWHDLPEALRTGKPQNETKHGRAGMFEELYSEPERLEQFMEAMAGISAGNFQAFVQRFDFSRYKTLCDVGGANGLLSMLVAQAHPQLHPAPRARGAQAWAASPTPLTGKLCR